MMATAPMVRNPPAASRNPPLADRTMHAGRVAWASAAALSGIVAAVAMPRGPVTEWQALAAMMLAAALGLSVGLAMRSRWAMLVGPLAHTAAFEIGRLGAEGQPSTAFASTGSFPSSLSCPAEACGVCWCWRQWSSAPRLGRRRPAGHLTDRYGVAVSYEGCGSCRLDWSPSHSCIRLPCRQFSASTVGPYPAASPASRLSRSGARAVAHDTRSQRVHPVLLHLAGGPGDSDIGDAARRSKNSSETSLW
jgi:hypothetical protein